MGNYEGRIIEFMNKVLCFLMEWMSTFIKVDNLFPFDRYLHTRKFMAKFCDVLTYYIATYVAALTFVLGGGGGGGV